MHRNCDYHTSAPVPGDPIRQGGLRYLPLLCTECGGVRKLRLLRKPRPKDFKF
jgi:hypothetical protein